MALRIYNTLTRQKELFEPIRPGKVERALERLRAAIRPQPAPALSSPVLAAEEALREQVETTRQAKQFALADSIRAHLAGLGVLLEDTREGTLWRFG